MEFLHLMYAKMIRIILMNNRKCIKMSNKKLLFYFFMIVVLASGICEAAIIITGNDYLYMPLMWIPAVAAMAVGLIRNYRKDSNFSMRDYLQGLGFHRCNIKYILLGCLLPLVYLLIPYIIYWSVYPEHFAYKGVSLLIILKDLVPVTIVGIVISLLSALGEEIGCADLWYRHYMMN